MPRVRVAANDLFAAELTSLPFCGLNFLKYRGYESEKYRDNFFVSFLTFRASFCTHFMRLLLMNNAIICIYQFQGTYVKQNFIEELFFWWFFRSKWKNRIDNRKVIWRERGGDFPGENEKNGLEKWQNNFLWAIIREKIENRIKN